MILPPRRRQDHFLLEGKIGQNHAAQNDAIPAKYFEVVLFNVPHEEFDDHQRDQESHQAAYHQSHQLRGVNTKPNFSSFSKLKPNITGTARKKVNSAAATRETPIRSAPMMVDPEREVPGMMDKT